MALTSHGWSGIWNLGSLDVHPIGYYMLLNLVRLVFGEHVVAYRLMSAAASCALVVAGYAMMRRDWGARAARLFAALACFAPPFMRMAFQIRMYHGRCWPSRCASCSRCASASRRAAVGPCA